MNVRETTEVRKSRQEESRAAEYDKPTYMGYVSPLDLPPGVAKDGFAYHWATMSIRGEPNHDVDAMAREGWMMVPIERAPRYSCDPLGRNELGSKFFTYKGAVLMEREKELCDRKTAYMNQRARDKIVALMGEEGGLKNDGYPMFATPGAATATF